MNKNKMALTALGLGAAFLMRNKGSRDKLAKQFGSFKNSPIRGTKADKTYSNSSKGKGILSGMFN
ncbi:hypothetical protein SAMN04487786_2387 [Paenisporosarcina quisquiliarum]|uniref:hypothetical protein n=1 Tax=Psychrobacillus TaxID=1221880 RepID=UPI0008B9CF47|nr:hypothetical protein SAMN04487786_2387 [Paenisporosarcina quisquiliarum]